MKKGNIIADSFLHSLRTPARLVALDRAHTEMVMAERPLNAFATLLRRMRAEARLSQEDLAHAAGLHPRAVSDLERGLVGRPRKDTVQLLADALHLEGEVRADFETVAWGRPRASGGDPKSWLNRVTAALDELGIAAASRVVAQWRRSGPADDAWPTWAERYKQPVVLVTDDAHRGGASSDYLLLDVARRVSAGAVAIVVALRPDELEGSSPIRPYSQEASDRAALDVIVTVRVPPLDAEATASLIGQRTGCGPPRDIVAEVLRQTGGRPHLIKHTPIQAPLSGGASSGWAVGQLGAEGLLVLESTVRNRPEAVRDVLQAAALCADGGYITPAFIARVTGIAIDDAERILDDERQSNAILTPCRLSLPA